MLNPERKKEINEILEESYRKSQDKNCVRTPMNEFFSRKRKELLDLIQGEKCTM